MNRSIQRERPGPGDDNAARLKTQAPPSASSEALLTVDEVAEILKVPVSWVYERTRRRGADRIPGFRLGKYWRFREADLLAWIDRQRSEFAQMLDLG
jgi:excisionase family DNA binding protein